MRVACVDSWGTSTSWWLRLQAEGADVRVWTDISDSPNGDVGKNLVPKESSYDRLIQWAKESPKDTVVLFCESHYGEKADALRKDGLYVVGGGTFADKLEDDRKFGQDVAAAVGMYIPRFESFTSISDAIEHYKGSREGGVFKSDDYLESDATQVCATGDQLVEYLKHLRERYRDRVKFIVQELVGGKESVDLDLARYWDGEEFVGPCELTFEHKRFLNEDLGPSTGCALNAVWFNDDCEFAREVNFDGLAEIYRQHDASPGIYAYNFRVSDDDGNAYYLETTPRVGYDSEMTAALLWDSLSDLIWRLATRQGGTQVSSDLAYGVRLSVSPYPHETVDAKDEHSAKGIPLPDDLGDGYAPPFVAYQIADDPGQGLYVASPEGIVGLACAVGNNLAAMGESVNDFIHDLHKTVSKLQARTDGAAVIKADAAKLEALGIDVHAGILSSPERAEEVA
jgi:phosphoribosylamine-glycine ligase